MCTCIYPLIFLGRACPLYAVCELYGWYVTVILDGYCSEPEPIEHGFYMCDPNHCNMFKVRTFLHMSYIDSVKMIVKMIHILKIKK